MFTVISCRPNGRLRTSTKPRRYSKVSFAEGGCLCELLHRGEYHVWKLSDTFRALSSSSPLTCTEVQRRSRWRAITWSVSAPGFAKPDLKYLPNTRCFAM